MGSTGQDGTLTLAPVATTDYELVVRCRYARSTSSITVSSPNESTVVDLVFPPLPGLPSENTRAYHDMDIKCRIHWRDSVHAHASWEDWWSKAPPPTPPACPEEYEDEYQAVKNAWDELIDRPTRDLSEDLRWLGKWELSMADYAEAYDAAKGALLADLGHLVVDTILDVIPLRKAKMVMAVLKGAFFGVMTNDWSQLPGIIAALREIPGVSEAIDILNMPKHACDWMGASQDCLYWGRIYWERRKEYDSKMEDYKANFELYTAKLAAYEGYAGLTCCELYCGGGSKSSRVDCDVCKPPPPDVPADEVDTVPSSVLFTADPNEKAGPAGFDERQFINAVDFASFVIYFENKPEASGWAQQITVADELSPDLDWRTFQLGEVAFNDTVVEVPKLRAHHTEDITFGSDLVVRIDAGLDIQTGIASWTLTAIDPQTGELPEDPLLGVLPPNDSETHQGEGHVAFSIRPRSDLPTGREVTNEATIVFDINEPIDTNEVFVTLDTVAPTSEVADLPAESLDPQVALSWSGDDDAGGSGLAGFTIYVSEDGRRRSLHS